MTFGILKLTLTLIISLIYIGTLGAQERADDKMNRSGKSLGIVKLNAPDLPPSGVSILTDILLEETMDVAELLLYRKIISLEALESFELYISGFAEDSTSKELNTLLGLDYVLSGKIGLLGNTFLVTLNLYNVSERSIEDIMKREHSGSVETLGLTIQSLVREMILGEVPQLDEEGAAEEIPEPVIADLEFHEEANPNQQREFQRTYAQNSLALFGSAYAVWVTNASLSMFDVKEERAYLGGTLVAVPIGFFTALNISQKSRFSVARTRMIASTTMWATFWGVTSMAVLNPEDSSPYLAFSLAAGGFGLYASTKYTSTHEITTSRVNFINIGAFFGSLFGLGVPYLLDVQDDGLYMAMMTAGGIAGGFVAFNASKDYSDYSFNDEIALNQKIRSLGSISDLTIYPKIFYNKLADKKLSGSEYPNIGFDISYKF